MFHFYADQYIGSLVILLLILCIVLHKIRRLHIGKTHRVRTIQSDKQPEGMT